MALSGVIDAFATGTYAVTRTVAATYDATGTIVPGSTSVVNIKASIQPLSGMDLQVLPEGHHASNVRKMYSKVEVFGRGPANDPDLVTFGGEIWEVLNVQAFEAFGLGSGGDHWKAMIARQATP